MIFARDVCRCTFRLLTSKQTFCVLRSRSRSYRPTVVTLSDSEITFFGVWLYGLHSPCEAKWRRRRRRFHYRSWSAACWASQVRHPFAGNHYCSPMGQICYYLLQTWALFVLVSFFPYCRSLARHHLYYLRCDSLCSSLIANPRLTYLSSENVLNYRLLNSPCFCFFALLRNCSCSSPSFGLLVVTLVADQAVAGKMIADELHNLFTTPFVRGSKPNVRGNSRGEATRKY